jgi:hypothetical protein
MLFKRRDPDIPKLKAALQQLLPGADITVRGVPYGDFLHVYVWDGRFTGLPADEREEKVWPKLKELLPPEITLRVSLCFLLAPGEEPRAA